MNLSHLLSRIEKMSVLYAATIIIVVTILVYINTLGNGLFYDDEDFIYKNQYVATFNVPKFFSENLIAGAGKISNYYRPVLEISFAFEHAIFGYSGFIYHLDSILLHIIASILIFLLIKKLFNNNSLALLTALLFAIHPIQTEAVSYASGRGDPLSLVFMLLAILLSFSHQTKYKSLSFLFTALALLSKELTLITPLLIMLTHILYEKKLTKGTIIKSIKIAFPYIIICGAYFFLRLTILNFQNTLNFYNGNNIYTQNIFIRINTFFNLIPKYVSLLFYPHTLFIERPATVYAALTASSVLVPFISIVLFIIGIKYFKRFPILLFSLLWFYIAFIPTSGIIPINGIFYEHFVYFPSIGFFALFSWIIMWAINRVPEGIKLLILICLMIYVSYFGIRTIARNAEWHDPITFYNQTLQYTKSSRLLNNLAMAYAENGEAEKSIMVYKKAIEEGDFYPQTHYNLANSYVNLGDLKSAESEYKKALKLDPSFYLSYLKLFEIYKQTKDIEKQQWVIGEVEKLSQKNSSLTPIVEQLKSLQNN